MTQKILRTGHRKRRLSSHSKSIELGVMARFGVGDFKASLGLALYVLGYGFGPLLWSPMSELPAFGRNVSYVATFAIYIILCVPTALVNNLGGLLVLRFLLGFFGSPCLATGGASMQDMYSLLYLPYSVALWVSAAFAAPAVGPLLSGFSVVAKNWRWSTWELLWMSAPVFILWFFCLPETSASNILLRRAARLRSRLEVKNIRSQSEIDREGLTAGAIFLDAIIKPCEIMIKDPAVLFTNVYTALTYGIYYSFFEAFPLVYGPLYGFNLGETGIVFLCIVVGCVISICIYFSYLHFLLIPDIMKNGLQAQEWRLRPALISVFVLTMSLFLFGMLHSDLIPAPVRSYLHSGWSSSERKQDLASKILGKQESSAPFTLSNNIKQEAVRVLGSLACLVRRMYICAGLID
ncbi:major facilitator superfamily domain-containing protein [Cryomyces antarcticus]